MYRLQTFAVMVFTPTSPGYIWQNGIDSNSFHLQPRFPRLGAITEVYVTGFGYEHLAMFFEPWFWIVASGFLIYLARKYAVRHRVAITMLCLSSLLYIASYLPTGSTGDYRYIYWCVYATLAAGVLLLADCKYRGVTKPKKVRKPQKLLSTHKR